ncbi:uncharacterized protein TNCV_4601391 [Trichonephila clavipes]|nr:uncharacterized protein TNCV_4601391 [Trichonephila clavipes]
MYLQGEEHHKAIANALFENCASRYGAPISLINDNGPQIISEVFEHISHKLDIKHIKTVTYRPQANLTERVNRTLVQMIACFVEENQENWDRSLHELAFALRTSVNETTSKPPADLLLGRNTSQRAEYVGRNIEKLFIEAKQNLRKQHKTFEKYYNRKRRDVNIKVNDFVLVQTHFMSVAGRRVVGKFMPKFEGPYRVLEVRNNNLIIWKKGKRVTVNIDQVRLCTIQDSPTQLGWIVMFCHYMKDRSLVMGRVDRIQKNPKYLGKPRVRRIRVVNQIREMPDWLVPRLKRKVGDHSTLQVPSHPIDAKQCKPPTEGSRQGASVQYDMARETRTTPSGGNSAAERRPVRSKQATAMIPYPYYLRSRVKQPEGITEEQRSNGIDRIPQNTLRRRGFSMEALHLDPVDRSE